MHVGIRRLSTWAVKLAKRKARENASRVPYGIRPDAAMKPGAVEKASPAAQPYEDKVWTPAEPNKKTSPRATKAADWPPPKKVYAVPHAFRKKGVNVEEFNVDEAKASVKPSDAKLGRYVNSDSNTLPQYLVQIRPRKVRVQREELFTRLGDLVKEHCGAGFRVQDGSFHTYARDVNGGPLEFLIFDGQNASGFEAAVPDVLPSAYDPSALAAFLSEHGFKVDPPASNGVPYAAYPAPLACLEDRADGLHFLLHPPSPLHHPLRRLFVAYLGDPTIANSFAVLWAWALSLRLPDVEQSPIWLALSFIAYLQVDKFHLNLQNIEPDAEDGTFRTMSGETVWVPDGTGGPQTSQVDLTAAYGYYKKLDHVGAGRLFYGYLRMLEGLKATREMISVQHGGIVARAATWKGQPLVVRDPFLPYWNHAASFTPDDYAFLREAVAKASSRLIVGESLSEVFGDRLLPGHPRLAEPHPVMATVEHLFKQSPVPPDVPEAERWRYFARELKASAGQHPVGYLKQKRRLHTSARRAYWTDSRVHDGADAYSMPDDPPPGPVAERVEADLWKCYENTRPSKSELEARKHALAKIRWIVRDYADKQKIVPPGQAGMYQVEPFGSTLIGVDRVNADLDLVVLDPAVPEGFKPGMPYKKVRNALYDVEKLAKVMKKHGCVDVQAIPRARVPIVRGALVPGKSSHKVDFDLSINSRNGLYNSRLLAAYADLDPRVRPLLVILKRWALASRLDHAVKLVKKGRGRTIAMPRPFSSYTMGQLVVAFMQHMGLLPNLQAPFAARLDGQGPAGGPMRDAPYMLRRLQSDGSVPEVYWSIMPDREDVRIPSDIRFLDPHSAPVQEWMAARDEMLERTGRVWNLTQLLQRFFWFYHTHFKYSYWAVSLRDGGVVHRSLQPGYRPPERLFNDLLRDLRAGRLLKRPVSDAGKEAAGEEPPREGDALEMDMRVERELALLLATPTDFAPWSKRPLVIADPIIRAHNISQMVGEKDVNRFVSECGRAARILRLGLGLPDLLSRASRTGDKTEKPDKKKKRQSASSLLSCLPVGGLH